MLKLGRIRIDNFKSFKNPVFFDFSGSDIILFDGPNGFGKTTIFDAIELCLTGKIHRIQKTDSKTKSEHILKSDNRRSTSIKLEILDGSDTILVIEAIIPANISGDAGKVANYKESIKRFELSEWNNEVVEYSKLKPLDMEKLSCILGNNKLESTFTLFNYIQQEETCHFLKLNENERHQQISHLFGTTDETKNANKLDVLTAKLKDEIDSYKSIIDIKTGELNRLSKPTNEDKDDPQGSGKIVILSNLKNSTIEQLYSYKNNLEVVDWILKNYQSYLDLKFNHYIDVITKNRHNELFNFIKTGSAKDYHQLEKFKNQYLIWKKSCSKAENYRTLIEAFDTKPNTLTNETLAEFGRIFPNKHSEFSIDIANFYSLKNSCDSSSILINKIDECRKNLISHYKDHITYDGEIKNKELPCPLCGDLKQNWQVLLDEYDEQALYFEKQLGENARLLSDVTKKLIKELITPLIVKMRRFTSRYKQYLNFDFDFVFKEKFIERQDFDKMKLVSKWLSANIDGSLDYQDKNLLDVRQNYSEVREQLIYLIEAKRKPVFVDDSRDYLSCTMSLKTLGLEFNDEEKIIVDSDDIDKDIQLLSLLLIQKNSSAYKIIEQELKVLNEKLRKLTLKKDDIVEISKIYRKRIKAYEKDVAKHIAIPLFIYSSKILQSRPEGSGVFLITPDTDRAKGFMQFSATPTDSHDAWNTMSSGQLSGIVISFMLAMNKVYPSKLSTLLIDDPVQTMDEVNMASFVQMMKYEFPEKQVLLSTHENKVANYFNYKYNEAGLKTLPINMKNKRLEVTFP